MNEELLNILLNYFPKRYIDVAISEKIAIRVEDAIIYEEKSVCHKKIILLKKDLEEAGYKVNGVVADVVYIPGLNNRLSYCKVRFLCMLNIPYSKRVTRKSLLILLNDK